MSTTINDNASVATKPHIKHKTSKIILIVLLITARLIAKNKKAKNKPNRKNVHMAKPIAKDKNMIAGLQGNVNKKDYKIAERISTCC